MALAEAGDNGAAQLRVGHIGNIDVEQDRLAQRLSPQQVDQFAGHPRRTREMLAGSSAQRNCQGRNAEQKTLGRRRDGTRIDRVVAHVGTHVDSRHHHVRKPVEHAGDGEMNTVGGRAIDVIETIGRAFERQGAIERQRVACPAAVAFGSHDGNFSDIRQHARQMLDPRSEITVIVTEQDPHGTPRTSTNTVNKPARGRLHHYWRSCAAALTRLPANSAW
ncbi:MAG: hypothetical protein AW09_002234 [Candidatus Accumulibacter phosphatis]|uniref:Uncharacterized protein n=1 Tax=Candidatus Accumulibacter phosphatis TaxID=327160 RepID=A0A080LVF5_9PROT|nr:MAG: hypothetical protein AW09_002234 [Candidatus Accumulibacter phosphatis]